MKKYLFLITVVAMIAATVLFAQQPPSQGQAGQGQAGQRQGAAPPGGAGARAGGARGGNQSINAAITAIEQQIATLKKAMEGAGTPGSPGAMGGAPGGQRGAGGQGAPVGAGQAGAGAQAPPPGGQPGAPGGQRGGMDMQAMQAMQAQMQKRNEAIQAAGAAIADQALVLKGAQARAEFQKDISELQSIADLADKQRAKKVAELVRSIIDTRQKAFQEKATKLGIPAQAGAGMRGRGEPPIKGGFEWIDK